MAAHDPQVRHRAASIAARAAVSRLGERGRRDRTAAARAARWANLEAKVDPEGRLGTQERRALAADLRRAQLREIGLRGVAALRLRKVQARAAEALR